MMDQGLFKLFPEDEESKTTPWHSVSGELMSAVRETFKSFEGAVMDNYEGRDLTGLRSFEKSLDEGFVDPMPSTLTEPLPVSIIKRRNAFLSSREM